MTAGRYGNCVTLRAARGEKTRARGSVLGLHFSTTRLPDSARMIWRCRTRTANPRMPYKERPSVASSEWVGTTSGHKQTHEEEGEGGEGTARVESEICGHAVLGSAVGLGAGAPSSATATGKSPHRG